VILFLSIQKSKSLLGYDVKCPIPDPKDEESLNKKDMVLTDVLIFLIGSIIGLFCNIFVIFAFLKYKSMRKEPGSLVLCISLTEFVACSSCLFSSIYYFVRRSRPEEQNQYLESKDIICQTNAFISVIYGGAELMYNCFLCLYLILKSSDSFSNHCKIPYFLYLVLPAICPIVPAIMSLNNKSLGKTMYGTCAYKSGDMTPYMTPLIPLVYIITGCFAIRALKRWQVGKKGEDVKNEFINYSRSYILAIGILWSIMSVGYVISALNCLKWNIEILTIFNCIAQMSKIGITMCAPLLRCRDPFLKKKIEYFVAKLTCKDTSEFEKMSSSSMNTSGGGDEDEKKSDDVELKGRFNKFKVLLIDFKLLRKSMDSESYRRTRS